MNTLFSIDYIAVADANLTTKKWTYANMKPYASAFSEAGLTDFQTQQ